jgi:hypothetical protein
MLSNAIHQAFLGEKQIKVTHFLWQNRDFEMSDFHYFIFEVIYFSKGN